MAYITNGHDINLKTFYPKTYLFGYGLLLLFSIVMLVIPVTYFLGFFMFLVLILGGLATTYYRLNKKLIKVYHLTKINNNVYEWVERWEDRKFVEENMDPAFFYKLGKELVPIIDYTTDTPKPFKPFDIEINSVISMDVGRATDQSASERMLNSSKSLWEKEGVRLMTYCLILGGVMFAIIAITGGEPPPPEIVQ
tara:strand:+ start:222 stop:806 length:585 start_codon:yes stop_codon:yes gene_type:complete